MIDLSDGLVGDLNHILEESGVGASVWLDRIPRSPVFDKWASRYHPHPLDLVLTGGEDYELLFTAPPGIVETNLFSSEGDDVSLYQIGEVTSERGKLSLLTKENKPYYLSLSGYDHFSSDKVSR
jgi:thiamine-monophosphate kinase